MGVVVNSLSSLYILRKPAEGISLTQEYISDPNNWKCPEDLVTVAMTREEYDDLEEVNPNVFYYIYENEITKTREPLREEYLTEEEFLVEWQKWTDSLKVLSQEYMSASWGVDIENKLGKKASSQSVSILMSEIKNIKGNGNTPSLESLNNSISELQNTDASLKERLDNILITHEDIEQGRLVNVEKEIVKVQESLSDYVTKDYIQDSSNEFIFVKESDYESDKKSFSDELAKHISSQKVTTESIDISGKNLEVKEDKLHFNDSAIAEVEDIPVLEILSQSDYDERDKSGDLDEDTYYYTFDGDVRMVTSEDLEKQVAKLQQQINVLFKGGTAEDIENTLGTIFLPIETWNTFYQEYQQLSTLVKDLEQRLLKLEPLNIIHTGDTIYVTGDPERCYQDGDILYIESENITMI